jgi:hypothetical protein
MTACASKSGAPVATTGDDQPEGPRWTGSLQPTQQRTGAVAVTSQNRVFGNVKVTQSTGGNLRQLHVSLTVAVPTSQTAALRWAILPERCGSNDLPLLGFEQFPLIDVSSSGRGQVEADLPLPMVANSTYHVNVYTRGQQLEDVLTCGNLKYEGVSSR